MLKDAGFIYLKAEGKTGFNSSPRTMGTLISAEKPSTSECCKPKGSKINKEVTTENKKNIK
ncbi:hypothetical protein [Ilyobacter sp.]|uniref:hypothetical protein n=1 Tax=Ilyobacter sp. TaxID=3100343 RepID=UPI003567FB7E